MSSSQEKENGSCFKKVCYKKSDDDLWCCKTRKYVFVHKYKSKFCRKIVDVNANVKGILKRKCDVEHGYGVPRRVSFSENDEIFQHRTYQNNQVYGGSKTKHSSKKRRSSLQFSDDLLKKLNSDFDEASKSFDSERGGRFLEYDSFDQPTITLSSSKMVAIPLQHHVQNSNKSLNNGIDAATANVHCHGNIGIAPEVRPDYSCEVDITSSPDCLKLNRRIKRRRSSDLFQMPSQQTNVATDSSEPKNLLLELKVLRSSSYDPPFYAAQCVRRKGDHASIDEVNSREPENLGDERIIFSDSHKRRYREERGVGLRLPKTYEKKNKVAIAKMPRTKQTKPRHYVEDLKSNPGGVIDSTSNSPKNNPENSNSPKNDEDSEENNLSLSDEDDNKISHPSLSPCLYDVNKEKNMVSDADGDTTDLKKNDTENRTKKSTKNILECQDVAARGECVTVSVDSNSDYFINNSPIVQQEADMTNQQNVEHKVDHGALCQLNEGHQQELQQNMCSSNSETADPYLHINEKGSDSIQSNSDPNHIRSSNVTQAADLDSPSQQNNPSDQAKSKQNPNNNFPTYQLNSGASAQYYESIKKLFENEASKNLDLNWNMWKSGLNPSQYNAIDFSMLNNPSLVNGYMKQILDYWHATMQNPSLGNSLLYPFQYGGALSTSKATSNVHSATLSSSPTAIKQESPAFSKVENPDPNEHNVLADKSEESSKQTKAKEEVFLHDRESKPLCLKNGKKWPEEDQGSLKGSCTISSQNSSQNTPSPSSLSSFSDQRSNSAKSSHTQQYDKQAKPFATAFYPYQSWPNSSWLGYPGFSGLPNHFAYNSYSSSLQGKDLPRKARNMSKSGDKSKKDAASPVDTLLHPNIKHNSSPSHLPSSTYDVYAESKASKKQSESITSQAPNLENSEAVKRGLNLPYVPYSSYWLGSVLPFNSTIPSPYSGMSLNAKKSNSKSLYPRDFMQFPGLTYPPSGSTYFPESLYKRDPTSMSKMLGSRRSRSRGSAFDSVHAAIVREAKEQSKGVDPENMYIQCPICQKRIKRLYHFQRHMRIHTGEKTHQCPCCQYKSVRKDNLKSHMKTHEKQNLEGGKKTGKFPNQNSRNSANLVEKTQIHSPGASSSHKSADHVNSSAVSTANDTCLNLSLQKPCLDLSGGDNISTSQPLSKSQFSDNFTYQNSIINDLKHAGREVNKMSPELSPNTSKTYDDNLKRILNGAYLEKKYVEDREKNDSCAEVNLSFSRPKSELIIDNVPSAEKKPKKRDLIFHPLQYSGSEISNKRRKLSREGSRSGACLSPNASNSNNNNDRTKSDKKSSFDKTPDCAENNFAKTSDISTDEIPAQAMNNKSLNFDKKDLVTLAEMSLNQTLPFRLQVPESITSSSSTLLQNSDPIQREKTPAASTGPPIQMIEDKTSIQAQPKAASTSNELTQNLPFSPNPALLYRPGNPLNILHPSKYHPMPLGLSLPNPHLNSVPNPLPKGLHQHSTARVKKELTSKLKSKESGSGEKAAKEKTMQDTSLKTLQCRLCSFSSLSNVDLQSHVTAKHKQNGFYKCEKCSYLGKNLSKLVEHIRIHTGERPFKCDQCNYAAKRKDNLAQHKAVRHDKRKAKSANHYSVIADLKPDSILAAHLARATKYDKDASLGSKTSFEFHQSSLSPRLNFYGSMNCDKKEQESKATTPASGSMTPSLHSFSSMPALPSSLFHYPFYRFPSSLNSPELETDISGTVTKTVNNPAAYSIKVRAALIAP